MALKQHFNDKLPDPQGPLLIKTKKTYLLPSLNGGKGVRRVVSQEPASEGPYAKFTAKQKAVIGKRATKHGVAALVATHHHFNTEGLSR